jgi:hypothetical protein
LVANKAAISVSVLLLDVVICALDMMIPMTTPKHRPPPSSRMSTRTRRSCTRRWPIAATLLILQAVPIQPNCSKLCRSGLPK